MTFTKAEEAKMAKRKADIAISLYKAQTKNISPNKVCLNNI